MQGGNVILDFVDTDGEGVNNQELERRYLYGPAVDHILSQENVVENIAYPERVYWPLADNLATVRDLAENDGGRAEHSGTWIGMNNGQLNLGTASANAPLVIIQAAKTFSPPTTWPNTYYVVLPTSSAYYAKLFKFLPLQ